MEILIKGISKSYGKRLILKDVNFSAKSGQCVGILGGNGSGKSTLLSILAGVQSANSGEFLYNGKDLFSYKRERQQLVGYIPQGTPLIEELNARDNLLLWYDKASMEKELSVGVLKMLGVEEFLRTTVSKMSGGMKKRLSIGCAVAKKPPILMLDEPMSALDLVCKQKISEYILSHKNNGGIAVLVTHDLLEMKLCDVWYILKDGVLEPLQYSENIDDLIKRF